MFTGQLKQFFKETAVLTVFLTIVMALMVLGLKDAHAAKPLSVPFSYSISSDGGSTRAGVTITLIASVYSGMKIDRIKPRHFSGGVLFAIADKDVSSMRF